MSVPPVTVLGLPSSYFLSARGTYGDSLTVIEYDLIIFINFNIYGIHNVLFMYKNKIEFD